jgi:uncharacterized UPF0160 family protein
MEAESEPQKPEATPETPAPTPELAPEEQQEEKTETKKFKTIATRDGEIMADQVLCAAMLFYYTKEFRQCQIIRTLDSQELKQADLLFDVGYQFNPKRNLFDHNQKDFARKYYQSNQAKMSSCSLILQKFGKEVI